MKRIRRNIEEKIKKLPDQWYHLIKRDFAKSIYWRNCGCTLSLRWIEYHSRKRKARYLKKDIPLMKDIVGDVYCICHIKKWTDLDIDCSDYNLESQDGRSIYFRGPMKLSNFDINMLYVRLHKDLIYESNKKYNFDTVYFQFDLSSHFKLLRSLIDLYKSKDRKSSYLQQLPKEIFEHTLNFVFT